MVDITNTLPCWLSHSSWLNSTSCNQAVRCLSIRLIDETFHQGLLVIHFDCKKTRLNKSVQLHWYEAEANAMANTLFESKSKVRMIWMPWSDILPGNPSWLWWQITPNKIHLENIFHEFRNLDLFWSWAYWPPINPKALRKTLVVHINSLTGCRYTLKQSTLWFWMRCNKMC